uniref:ARHGEF1-like PH domain-containing protein n=1 Tax=Parascaris equorum TaxID=6256 RepID=A0A914R7Y9_PAREQ
RFQFPESHKVNVPKVFIYFVFFFVFKRTIVFRFDNTLSNLIRGRYLHVINLHYYLNCSYKLVHDGALTWRFSRGKMVELHVGVFVLFKDIYVSKLLALDLQEPSKDTRWSPILPLAPLIAKEKANDKRAFFIVNTLVAATATERKTSVCLSFFAQSVSATFHFLCHSIMQVSTHPRLVNANEITVQQPTVLQHAQPILTPTERLRRNDEVIVKALLDKHLTAIAAPLMNHLKAMMQVVQDQQNEISAVKQQLYHYKVSHSNSFIARSHFLLLHLVVKEIFSSSSEFH